MTKKRKSGPECKYRPAYVEEARQLCADGALIHELAARWGVKTWTVNSWRRENPELDEAIAEGRAEAAKRSAASVPAIRRSTEVQPRRFHKAEMVYVRP